MLKIPLLICFGKHCNIIIQIITDYIFVRIPKYTTCFFNMDTFMRHSEAFFFIGIDDDGMLNGIPFHFDFMSQDKLCELILFNIDKSLRDSIVNNQMPIEDLINCIEL